MKHFIQLLLIALCGTIFVGCSSVKSTSVVNQDYDACFPNSLVLPPMLHPEVEVGVERIYGEASFSTLFGIIRIGEPKKDAYDFAVNQALNSVGAHFLVAPRAEYITTNYFFYKKGLLKVRGFPGKYKSFRQLKGKEYIDHLDALKGDKDQFKLKEKSLLSQLFN